MSICANPKCGRNFTVNGRMGRPQKFCSRVCCDARYQAKRSESARNVHDTRGGALTPEQRQVRIDCELPVW